LTGPALADAGDAEAPFESAAFPRFVRHLAIVLMAVLFIAALMASAELRAATWSWPALALFGAAWLCITWFGYWLLHSRTRLEGDVLTQTWLWTKRTSTAEVAHMKLVHWPMVDAVIAPRLFIRQRNGSMLWFHAADGRILHAFIERVGRHRAGAQLRTSAPA
jgi:hypothetical protein